MGLEVEVVADTNKFDVIVIGGGIAGMMCSAMITQAGVKSCFLEKEVPGGKLMYIDVIHNFSQPGIAGPELAQSIFKQATDEIKTKYIYGNVTGCRPKNDKFYLFTEDGQSWEAKAIVIATGTVNKKLNVPGEEKFINHGVSQCVLCDATLTKGKKVVLIGNTNHLETLKKFTNDVVVIQQQDIEKFVGNDKLTGVVKKDGTTIECDYAFVEIGFSTNVGFLPSEIIKTAANEIVVDGKMANPFPGVFACGDCTNSAVKMIQPAMEQAATAASSAVEYVNSRKW